jgi:hypothetical protein
MRRKYKQAKAGHVTRWVGDWLEDPTFSFLPLLTSALSLPSAFQRHQSPVTQEKGEDPRKPRRKRNTQKENPNEKAQQKKRDEQSGKSDAKL